MPVLQSWGSLNLCDFSWSASNIAQLRDRGVPVPLFLEQTVEVIKVICRSRCLNECGADRGGCATDPGEIVEIVRFLLGRIQHRIVEEMLMFRYHFQEQIAELIKVICSSGCQYESWSRSWRQCHRSWKGVHSFQGDWRRWRFFFSAALTPFFALLQVV